MISLWMYIVLLRIGRDLAAAFPYNKCISTTYLNIHCNSNDILTTHLPTYLIDSKTQRTHGRQAQIGNIAAARAVADIIRSTLGPRSMLKVSNI